MALTNTLDSNIGRRIKELRKIHHMTQELLAEKLDISIKHISSVERGISRLSLEKMIQLCGIMDCSLDYLVLGKTPAGDEIYLPDTILETLRSDDEHERTMLIEYLGMFARIRD